MHHYLWCLTTEYWKQLSTNAQTWLKSLWKLKWKDGESVTHSVVSNSLWDPMDCSPPGSSVPGKNTGVGCHTLLQGIFLTQGQTWVSCIAGRFLTVWATREVPWKLRHIYIRAGNCSPQDKSGPLPIFVNKVLLAHSHAHWLTYCLWPLLWCNGETEQLQQRPYDPQCRKYLSSSHSPGILAWGIPGTEEPCGLPSMGSHRVGHNRVTSQQQHLQKKFADLWVISLEKSHILLAPFSKKLQSVCKVGLVIYLLDMYL